MHTAPKRRCRHKLYLVCCIGLTLSGSISAQPFFTKSTDQIDAPLMPSNSSSFGDYDNDGWPDLFLAENGDYRVALLHNEGNGTFTDRRPNLGSHIVRKLKGGGSIFGDYDNDGDLDLYVTVGSFLGTEPDLDILLRNDQGTFTNVTRQAGLTDSLSTDNAIWLDYNRDGHLDLYMGHRRSEPVENTLFRNNGDGTFTDATAEAGLDVEISVGFGYGSNGGMAAGDFNNDGWPDLYLGVFFQPNRLFLNDQQGKFVDATTDEIGDDGLAFSVAVGDIDNDMHLDLFQAASQNDNFRSSMFLNLGEAQLLDVTEGIGLAAVTGRNTISTVGLGDIDNDGDLDLLLGGETFFLFLNNGDGTFVDHTAQSGIEEGNLTASFGDYNLDGFLDVIFGANAASDKFGGLYLNNGNDNHYLRVELVGTQSNRNGIGARLIASAGELSQMRDMLGGQGRYQDELVAHFGLGQHTQADRLEIRWPSGQVDVLTNIAADQKIRVFEGRQDYHPVRPTTWEHALPDTVVAGQQLSFQAVVRPALFEPEARITRAMADLRSMGGTQIELTDRQDGTYQLNTAFEVDAPSAQNVLSILIEQETSLGLRWTRLSKNILVFPNKDLAIVDKQLAPGWRIVGTHGAEETDLTQTDLVYQGATAAAIQAKQEQASRLWQWNLIADIPVDTLVYKALHFAFHPGEAQTGFVKRFDLGINNIPRPIDLVAEGLVDLELRDWQIVEIPLAAFPEAFTKSSLIETIQIFGSLEGTFYLDDIRLVATPSPAITAVLEEHTSSLPTSFALWQNYPNPFNSGTVIRFALPQSQEVELAVFNLAGQKVATLLQGMRPTGNYTINWDGRDNNERALASGMYLYRLRAGQHQETRKLLLLR